MHIRKLTLLTPFRGLQANSELAINTDAQANYAEAIQPVCLVGRNGSGKSNAMEFMCEVFYYLDWRSMQYAQNTDKDTNEHKARLAYFINLGFAIEYDFYYNNKTHIVHLEKQAAQNDLIFTLDNAQKTLKTRDDWSDLRLYLPKRLLGYSSGHNELLSNPFMRMRFNYYETYLENVRNANYLEIDLSRLFYMNNETNALVLLANYLMIDDEQIAAFQPITAQIKLKNIASFRIVIERNHRLLPNQEREENNEQENDEQENDDMVSDDMIGDETFSPLNLDTYAYENEPLFLDAALSESIDWLQACATTCHSEPSIKERVMDGIVCTYTVDILELDYFVDDATRAAFKYFFGDAKKLFEVLYELNLLNIHTFSEEQIKTVLDSERDFDITAYLPRKAQNELIFNIEDLQIEKTTGETIDYRALSDGEHQFLHILGTVLLMDEANSLFVLDEPETHFNPEWRSKLVSSFNKIAEAQSETNDRRQQMFVLTTHSPFVVSDCRTENVFKFEKGENPRNLDITTYGAPFDELLVEAFGKAHDISEMVEELLETCHQEAKKYIDSTEYSIEIKIEKLDSIKAIIRPLGDSVRRNMLLEFINRQQRVLQSAA
jgi:restriction system-associated AAA family ATPase